MVGCLYGIMDGVNMLDLLSLHLTQELLCILWHMKDLPHLGSTLLENQVTVLSGKSGEMNLRIGRQKHIHVLVCTLFNINKSSTKCPIKADDL